MYVELTWLGILIVIALADIESLHVGQMWARQGAGFLVLGHLFRAMMG